MFMAILKQLVTIHKNRRYAVECAIPFFGTKAKTAHLTGSCVHALYGYSYFHAAPAFLFS